MGAMRERKTQEASGKRGHPVSGDDGSSILVENLSHDFVNAQTAEAVRALDGVDLTIRENEFVTVVGPSGCGKSTLLKAIAGLVRPSEGSVFFRGRRVEGPGPDRGVVFQDLAILPWRNVRRNIGHGLEIQKVPKEERARRVDNFVELMGLEGFEGRYPYELSGGMKQRVAVARTWAADPDVILMDEPFAAVDAQTRLTLQEELLRISVSNKKSLLFITHNVEEAVFLGDRVVVMTRRPGRIKETVEVPIPRSERNLGTLMGNREITAVTEHVMQLVRAEV
jgi:NitT/TauT family transport system ATP-binding protein